MRKREYSLYVIKPDGVKNQVQEVVHSYIAAHNYTIEDERSFMLPADKIPMLFNTGGDMKSYTEYMTEDMVIVGVCSGVDVCQGLNEIKYNIRAEHNCTKYDMKNLMHSCEPGTEAMREFNFFFPEWKEKGWKPTADMSIPITRNNYEQIFEKIATETNLEYAGLILMEKKLHFKECIYNNIKLLYGVQILSRFQQLCIPLLVYFPHGEQAEQATELSGKPISIIIDHVHKNNGMIASGFFSYNYFHHEMVTCIDEINNIYLHDPRYSYRELNTLEHWSVVVKKMNYIGGSWGLFPLGEFGIPASAVKCAMTPVIGD